MHYKMNNEHYAIIMAGGVGSRFWPISRRNLPKQFIDILGTGKTLIQDTYNRFKRIVPEENIYILTNHQYTDLVRDQLGIEDDFRIIGEPAMRNTAPCIAYACHKINALNNNACVVISPSDHLVLNTDQFIADIQLSLYTAQQTSALFTLGVKPSRPDTGYGYIRYGDEEFKNGFRRVEKFVEKPDFNTAQGYVDRGDYLWNSGVFIWNIRHILNELHRYQPEMNAIFMNGYGIYNTIAEQEFMNAHYAECQDISIDYAILEKSEQVYVLPVDFGWSDLGTWTSVYNLVNKDFQGNALIPNAENILLYNSYGCVFNVPQNKRVVVKDLHNYIIVESNNTLLIYPKSGEQEIKQVVKDATIKFGESNI